MLLYLNVYYPNYQVVILNLKPNYHSTIRSLPSNVDNILCKTLIRGITILNIIQCKENESRGKTFCEVHVSVPFVMVSRALISSRNKSGMTRGIHGTKRNVMKCVRVQA